MPIDSKSLGSHALVLYAYSRAIGRGTGFIVEAEGIWLLITNYHVLSGAHPDSGQLLPNNHVGPDRVLIPFLDKSSDSWKPHVQHLWDGDTKAWVEHPTLGRAFDVVALPIAVPSYARVFPYSVDPGPEIALPPGSDVAIVGFPQGMTGFGIAAIWKAGTIASDTDLPVGGKLYFWIDANTRTGMSGSPVVARRFGSALMPDGSLAVTGLVDRTIGVYAGRAFDAPDITLGRVWLWSGVVEVIQHAVALVHRGIVRPLVGTVGHYPEPGANMVRINTRLTATLRGHDATGKEVQGNLILGDILRDTTLADDRFGASLDQVRMAATIAAAIEAAREGDGFAEIEDAHYAVLCEAVRNPTKPYNAAIARHLLPLFDHVLEAGKQP